MLITDLEVNTSAEDDEAWRQQDGRTQMVMDLPTEAQFYPRLWGSARVDTAISLGGTP
jgi:hypothetical protein